MSGIFIYNNTEKIQLSFNVDAPTDVVFKDWLSSKGHTAMTGSPAKYSSGKLSSFSAWDDYISGKTIETKKDNYIKQTWRTTEFDPEWPDSTLEVFLEDKKGKTKITIKHSQLQKGDGQKYKTGWIEFYKEPMQAYYSGK